MKGLSIRAVEAIENLIDGKFNTISLSFLGLIPKMSREKKITFASSRNSLTSLFLQSLGSRNPNETEENTLKTLLRVANGYVDALKSRTKSNVVHAIDGYVKEQNLKQKPVSVRVIRELVDGNMDKADSHLKLIANAESNKAINTGTALQITKLAGEKGEDDPTVFFVVTVDDVTGFYEYILHLLPDKITPRIWKLSEISASYYKNGDLTPSLLGLHPNCRCKITYLAKGWGFNSSGGVSFIGLDHDEFKTQREKYGLPNVPQRPKKKNGEWVLPNG